jgi:predicted nucleic acid-binding protein
VSRAFIVDASPLTLPARIERLDLLSAVAGTALIPEAVLREVDAGNGRDGAGLAVNEL